MTKEKGAEVEGLARSAVVGSHYVGSIWVVLVFIRVSDSARIPIWAG